jgi:hypothetical protein
MALWGNNDAKGSGGTVSLNYATLTVTGSGTTFGQVGAAATGDVIRFGLRTGTYYGDAVIVGIASTTQLSIASTSNLSGASISGVQFDISQLPKYTVLDSTFSAANIASPSFVSISYVGTATTNAGIGTNIVPVVVKSGATTVVVGDALVNNGNNIQITAIGAANISLASTISAGIATGATLTFKRLADGYSKSVYGVADAGIAAAQGTAYELTHEGWVGLTTYRGSEGELRVKKEVLVAMSGITTGNTPLYDANPLV